MRQLHLIKYTDSEGNAKTFRLLEEIQNNCRVLGIVLGIEKATLFEALDKRLTPVEQCEFILSLWLMRGDGEYSATWAGLLQALEDVELGGVARHLREALTLTKVQ